MIDVPEGQNTIPVAEASSQPLKHGKSLGAKDKVPQKRKAPNNLVELLQIRQENVLLSNHFSYIEPPEEVSPINTKISINYVLGSIGFSREGMNRDFKIIAEF